MGCTLRNGEVGNINLGLIISDNLLNNLRVHELQEVSHMGIGTGIACCSPGELIGLPLRSLKGHKMIVFSNQSVSILVIAQVGNY